MRRDEDRTTSAEFPAVPGLSIVAPLYDEEALIAPLVARLTRVIDSLPVDAEVILIDDGSRDGTLAQMARAHKADRRFVGVALSRNFGHQLAITAGLAHARGDAVVVMDGDLQDPPEAIATLWAKYREGYDVVYAVRASRPEGVIKRFAYRTFYRVLDRLVTIEIPRDSGDFGIMSRRVVDQLNAMPERGRFVRGLRAWVGFRQTGVWIDRAPRFAGRPKFTLRKLMGLALDGVVGFSDAPLRWAGGFGALVAMVACWTLYAGVIRGLVGWGWPAGWFWVGMFVALSAGAQLLFLAVLGEYVARILGEVNGRPLFVVRRRIGIGPPRRRIKRRGRIGLGATDRPQPVPDRGLGRSTRVEDKPWHPESVSIAESSD
jgi:polyisoprenyl-phosphate glycosyltransferase